MTASPASAGGCVGTVRPRARAVIRVAHLVLAAAAALAATARAATPPDPQPDARVVFEGRGSFSSLRVTDYPATGLRCLEFPPGRVLQSCARPDRPADLSLPYLRSMTTVLALHPGPRSALFLGLGAGSLPSFLQRHAPELRQVVVEIDPAVVEVARRFFGFKPSPATRVEIGDARAFVTRTPAHFDLVFIDAYGPDDVPRPLTTVEFHRAVRSCLAPGGVVAANLWGPRANPLYDRQIRSLTEVYGEVLVLESGRVRDLDLRSDGRHLPDRMDLNRVAVARAGPLPSVASWAARGRLVSRERRLPYDLGPLLERELLPPVQPTASAAPLTDGSP